MKITGGHFIWDRERRRLRRSEKRASVLRPLLRQWRFWLGLLVSLVFIWWLWSQITNFGQVQDAFQTANYWYLLPALAVYFLGVWVRAVRWRYLLAPVRLVPSSRLFPVVVIGYMANDVLPARMGELVRAYAIGEKENVSKSAAFATIVVERIFDGLTMVLFIGGVLVMGFFPFGPDLQRVFGPDLQKILAVAGIIFVGIFALFVAVAASPALTNAIVGLMLRFVPAGLRPKVSGLVQRFVEGLGILQSAKGTAIVLGLSVLAWLCEAAMYYILTFSFNLPLPFYALMLTAAVANLGTLVPSSPGYVGTFDALAVFALLLFLNADTYRNVAVSYTVLLHVALLVPITILGLYYWWRFNLSLSKVRAAATTGTNGPTVLESEKA